MCNCGGGAEHQHGLVAETTVIKSLHPYFELDKIVVLNARKPVNTEYVFRPKFDDGKSGNRAPLSSDVDPQLIIKIPFSGLMKIKSISLHTHTDGSSPSVMKAFINQPDLDFGSIDSKAATQEWTLVGPQSIKAGEPLSYQTKVFKFANVSHLTLYFPSNYGSEVTKIGHVGLFGEFTLHKANPVITKYELLPNPADHKKAEMTTSKQAF